MNDTEQPKSNTHQKLIPKFRAWLNNHRMATIIIVSLLGVVTIGNIAYALINQPQPRLDLAIPVAQKQKFYSPLTGVEVKNESDLTRPVTAVMVENSPDARPQSGLSDGEIIYEAVAEAGITRFMVLYQQNSPKKIGPVRSVRPYYVEWFYPYDASIAHVGGSPKALSMVRNGKVRDIDQFFNPGSYWRSTDRYAPHNVYTSGKSLASLNKSKHYLKSDPMPLERKNPKEPKSTPTAESNTPAVKSITIKLGGSDMYDSSYRFDSKHNTYIRYQAGSQHKDQQKGLITPKVVIALTVDQGLMSDGYHTDIATSGSGKAHIFQNGKAIKATWHKKSRASQLYFTDEKGKNILLEPGQTWIVAVPKNSGSVKWK
jgi:hypothetical protein